MAYPIARRTFLPFVRIFAKHIEGSENIPTGEAVIIAANHLGLFDPLFISAIYIQRTQQKLRFLIDTRNVFWKTIGYYFQHWTNTIAVRPGQAASAVEQAVRYLKTGDSVGLFPEGKINTSPTLLSGRTGAVRMSLLSGRAILPVGIENTNVPLMKIVGRRFINLPEGISIRFGQPYRPTGDPSNPETVRRSTDDLMSRIALLSRKQYAI